RARAARRRAAGARRSVPTRHRAARVAATPSCARGEAGRWCAGDSLRRAREDDRRSGMSDRQHEAAEIVQNAALEAIKAMKAFLEVAEAVVREPSTAATVGKAFAEAAASAFRPPTAG